MTRTRVALVGGDSLLARELRELLEDSKPIPSIEMISASAENASMLGQDDEDVIALTPLTAQSLAGARALEGRAFKNTDIIAVSALGPQNVLGVAMPGPYSSEGSLRDAQLLAQRRLRASEDRHQADAHRLGERRLQDRDRSRPVALAVGRQPLGQAGHDIARRRLARPQDLDSLLYAEIAAGGWDRIERHVHAAVIVERRLQGGRFPKRIQRWQRQRHRLVWSHWNRWATRRNLPASCTA